MALQVINVGTTPNDGQGDAIRTAYIKCNDNFAELYSRVQTTPPSTLIGAVGDQAGMYAYDQSFWYYCFANYDGVNDIWAQVAQVGNISVSGIQNGNSSIIFDDINGNAVINVHGTSNVAVFRSSGFFTSSNVTAVDVNATNINATNFSGTIVTAAQTNITSVGTLTGLDLTGALTSVANISTTGNVIGGNLVVTSAVISSRVSSTGNVNGGNLIGTTSISTPGTVSATGNITTDGYFVGAFFGNVTGNFVVPGSNTQVIFNSAGNADASSNFTFNKATNVLQVTGNVSTGNVISTTVSASGNITGGNFLTSGLISATSNITSAANVSGGNVLGGNVLATTIVSGASHIGSIVSVSANVTGGNIVTANASIIGNTGTISALGNITGGNLLATTIVSAASHIGSIVSASGDVTGGNLLTGGSISATSNITGANLNIAIASVSGNILTANASIIGNTGTISASGNITGGNFLTSGVISATSNITSSGNISGTYILGDGSQLTGLPATYGNTNVAAYLASGSANSNIVTTANISGGNVLATTIVSGASLIGTIASVSGNVTGGNLFYGSGNVSGTGNVLGGNVIATTIYGTIATNNIINTGSNGTGNIGNSISYFNTVYAQATQAQYADLAEKYIADAMYAPGTVVVIGGEQEVTASTVDQDRAVAGVVSTKPAHVMNSGLEGNTVITVALIGRVPCLVQGPIKKGDLLVSTVDGRARSEENPRVGTVLGKALENFEGNQGIIEIVVGKL